VSSAEWRAHVSHLTSAAARAVQAQCCPPMLVDAPSSAPGTACERELNQSYSLTLSTDILLCASVISVHCVHIGQPDNTQQASQQRPPKNVSTTTRAEELDNMERWAQQTCHSTALSVLRRVGIQDTSRKRHMLKASPSLLPDITRVKALKILGVTISYTVCLYLIMFLTWSARLYRLLTLYDFSEHTAWMTRLFS